MPWRIPAVLIPVALVLAVTCGVRALCKRFLPRG